MCDPVTALTAASVGVKAVSSVFGGISARNAANQNAAVAQQNAAYANQQAGDAIDIGSSQVAQHYLQVGQLRGQQTAAEAANGVELGFGSPLEVVGDTSTLGEIDAQTLRENARRNAENYRIQAANYANQASGYRAQGQASFISGLLGGAGSILSGAAQIAGGMSPSMKLTPASPFTVDTLTPLPSFGQLSTSLPSMSLGN